MLDNERAVIGDNNPPAYDPAVLTVLSEQTDDFMQASEKWLQLEAIETQAHAEQLTDQVDGIRGLYKRVDTARKDAKKPHDDAGKEVQAAFSPLLTKLKTAADKLKVKLADYAKAQAEKAEAERREREEAARRAQAEAEAAQRQAEQSGTISDQVDAEAQAKAAEQATKAAAAPVKTGVKSASGAGRTLALRTTKHVEITNINVLFMALREEPEVIETLQRVATRIVRSKDYDGTLAGVKVTETKAVA